MEWQHYHLYPITPDHSPPSIHSQTSLPYVSELPLTNFPAPFEVQPQTPRADPVAFGSRFDFALAPSLRAHTPRTYSFTSLPGTSHRRVPRRRHDEIERIYECSYSGCTKTYGTLNHLNAHITVQRHGNKRTPNEFIELRKLWRERRAQHRAAQTIPPMASTGDIPSYDHNEMQSESQSVDPISEVNPVDALIPATMALRL